MKINLTIDGTNKRVQVDYLKSDNITVSGTDYIVAANTERVRDEKDGWWFNNIQQTEFNRKIIFANIVNYNGSPIGRTTQEQITTALLAVLPTA